MIINIPEKPSDFINESYYQNATVYFNSQILSKNVYSILIYHILNGKYVSCYDENENLINSMKLATSTNTISFLKNNEEIFLYSN